MNSGHINICYLGKAHRTPDYTDMKTEQLNYNCFNKKLVGNIEVGGKLGRSDHEMVDFRILTNGRKESSKIHTLDLRKADFGYV